jgi:hypothetical protein
VPHVLPSPLTSSPPLGALQIRLCFEMHVLPRTAAIDAVEAGLAAALVTMVGGSRLAVSPAQVYSYLNYFFNITAHEVQVHHAHPYDLLLIFTREEMASRVLHAIMPEGTEFSLFFCLWRRQSGALRTPLRFKVLLVLENLPAHVWSVECAQVIIGSSCLCFEPGLQSVSMTDMTCFYLVIWTIHLDLIPVRSIVLFLSRSGHRRWEPPPPTLPRTKELIHSKRDTLQYRILIHVLEVHDFSPLFNFDDDSSTPSDSSNDSNGDGLPSRNPGTSSLWPWIRIYRLAGHPNAYDSHLPALPCGGGGASWLVVGTQGGAPWSAAGMPLAL